MIWISHSEIIFQVAFSLDATQLLGLALSADRLAAAAGLPLYRPAGSLRCSPRAQPSETAEFAERQSKYSSPTLLLHQEERPLPPDGPEACLTPSETKERHVVLGYLPALNERLVF